jgi:hypothetical protein
VAFLVIRSSTSLASMPLLASTSSRGFADPKIELFAVEEVEVKVEVLEDPRGLSYNVYIYIYSIMDRMESEYF